jgi:hypothetical protein
MGLALAAGARERPQPAARGKSTRLPAARAAPQSDACEVADDKSDIFRGVGDQ